MARWKHISKSLLADENDNVHVYSRKWLKVKLQQKYNEHIVFTEEEGRANSVYFQDMAKILLMISGIQIENKTQVMRQNELLRQLLS